MTEWIEKSFEDLREGMKKERKLYQDKIEDLEKKIEELEATIFDFEERE